MPTVSYVHCPSWSQVFENIRKALKEKGYPDLPGLAGGQKNVCCAHFRYKDTGWSSIVETNEGYGGLHSEAVVLSKIQHRKLAEGEDVYVFTERAPCANCQISLSDRARTFGRNINVIYMTPYTDTDADIVDSIMKDIKPCTAVEARQAVADLRRRFP